MSYTPLIQSTIPSPEYYNNYGTRTNKKDITDKPLDSSVNKESEQKNNKTRNMLLASLMALATLTSLPFVTGSDDSPRVNEDNKILETGLQNNKSIGDYENTQKLMGLINFDSMNGLSETQKKSIEMLTIARLNEINALNPESKSMMKSQVNAVQRMVDKMSSNYKDKYLSPEDQIRMEMAMKFVTDDEILDNIDFSELSKYQNDLTVLKALIAGSRERIRREDPESEGKVIQQVKDGQTLVNIITTKYKQRAKVAGNTDGDNSLSLKELLQMLNLSSLDGLSSEEQMNILRGALSNYKTQYFSTDNDDEIKRSNEELTKVVQDAQDKIDSQADAHKRFNISRNH